MPLAIPVHASNPRKHKNGGGTLVPSTKKETQRYTEKYMTTGKGTHQEAQTSGQWDPERTERREANY